MEHSLSGLFTISTCDLCYYSIVCISWPNECRFLILFEELSFLNILPACFVVFVVIVVVANCSQTSLFDLDDD